ncbi:MAG: BtpA/SgcQ family protein [Candidatus Sumerlaeaceae bacterium]|jgi:membrane complex biogenesis BtpA family protein
MKGFDWSRKVMIGMVHLRALPGTPRASLTMREICATAVREAALLREAGFDAVLIENMHDVPYVRRNVGPEITAAVTAALCAVRQAVDCPIGVQILAGANQQALAAAFAADAQFVRCEGFVFGHIADEGWIESDAGELLRMRKAIGAHHVAVFADVKKKHSSHAVTSDVSLGETAQAAEFFGADGIIVTGRATAEPTAGSDLQQVRQATQLPVLVGSGTTLETLAEHWSNADGFIVGSWLKSHGRWDEEIDPERVALLMAAARRLREATP